MAPKFLSSTRNERSGKGVPEKEENAEGSHAKAMYSVTGMTCSACSGQVERALRQLPGIQDAVVDALSNRAQVTFYPALINVSVLDFRFYLGVFGLMENVKRGVSSREKLPLPRFRNRQNKKHPLKMARKVIEFCIQHFDLVSGRGI